jgi:hypothetical protein
MRTGQADLPHPALGQEPTTSETQDNREESRCVGRKDLAPLIRPSAQTHVNTLDLKGTPLKKDLLQGH